MRIIRSQLRYDRSLLLLVRTVLAFAFTVSCGGDGGTGPGGSGSPNVPFRVIAGGGTTDTIQAKPVQALTVEIRDSTGKLAAGRTVRFEALPTDDPKRSNEIAIQVASLAGAAFSEFASDVADVAGRANVLVAFGTIAGTARIRVSVPELGRVDTVSFTVKPGLPSRIVIGVRDTTVQPGATYSLRASLQDRFSNPTPNETPTYTGIGVVSVSAAGLVTVGTSIVRGVIVVAWRTVTDTARVTVVPRLPLVANRASDTPNPFARSVALVNLDGTGSTLLADTPDYSLAPHSVKATSSVVYYQGDPNFSGTIWLVKAGSAPTTLVSRLTDFYTAAWPRWAPDGSWIYFTGMRTGPDRSLWRIRPDGTQVDSLGSFPLTFDFSTVSISPDGTTAAIPVGSGVQLINVNTKSSQTVAANCGQPRYSPDGQQFACIRNRQLSVMNIDGSSVRLLGGSSEFPYADAFDDLSGVDWTPDGKWLLARSPYLGVMQLVSVADGTRIDLGTLGSVWIQASFVR